MANLAATLRAAFVLAWPVLGLLLMMAAGVLIVSSFGSISLQRTLTEGLIKIVTVVGLYIFIGNSGVISFGQTAFMAVAAYASAWQTCCPGLKPITMHGLPEFLIRNSIPIIPAGLISILLSALVALIVGLVVMRLSGLAASIATLAVLFILNAAYSNWDSVTMGVSSIVGLPTYVTPWIAYSMAAGAMIVAYLFQISRFGLMLRATREDEVAARSVGLSVFWLRLIAFVLSGIVMGLAGVLHAHFLGTISIDTFFLNLTFITLAMLVVGGTRSLFGAVAGVFVVMTVIDVFRRVESGVDLWSFKLALPAGTQEVILAMVLLGVLIFRPNGLTGGRELTWPFTRSVTRSVDSMEKKRGHVGGKPAR